MEISALPTSDLKAAGWKKAVRLSATYEFLTQISINGHASAYLAPWRGRTGFWQFLGVDPLLERTLIKNISDSLLSKKIEGSPCKALLSPLATPQRLFGYYHAGYHLLEEVLIFRAPLNRLELEGPQFPVWEEEHIKDILEVDSHSFEPFWQTSARELLGELKRQTCLGLSLDGQAAGYAMILKQNRWGTISRMAVKPQFRQQNWGLQLLRACLRLLLSEECKEALVTTQSTNIPAQALYRKAGMRENAPRLSLLGYPWEAGDERWQRQENGRVLDSPKNRGSLEQYQRVFRER